MIDFFFQKLNDVLADEIDDVETRLRRLEDEQGRQRHFALYHQFAVLYERMKFAMRHQCAVLYERVIFERKV